MKKYMLRYLPQFLVLAIALFCWYNALISSGDIAESASSISLRYGTDGIPCSTINRMLEEESGPFAAWVQKNNQQVSEQEFFRDTDIQVLEIVGDAELVLPAEELLHGFLPVRESLDTCAIDATSAYALWGGTDVIGETLLYDNKEYTITGVFSQPENAMLIQCSPVVDTIFPCLELSVSGSATPRQQADEFRARYSLPESDMLTDNAESAAILRQLALLPALFAAAMLLWRVLRRCFGKPVSSLGRTGFAVVMVAGVLISAWGIGFSPVVPAIAVPGRWSDFSFWSGLMEYMTKQARLSRTLTWPSPDLLRLKYQHSLLLYSGVALAGFVISILWKSGKQGEEQ